MFYIPKIGGYLNILTNNEVKDFVAINFGEYLKSMRKKLCGTVRNKILEMLFNHFISF